MEKIKKLLPLGFCFLCIMLVLPFTACRDYYWFYDCDWVSEDSQIVLNKGCGDGRMYIANMCFNFFTGIDNDATGITFYDEAAETVDGKYKVLWVADTELKDGKLYLTITTDNISNYEGKTIILYQRPVQNEEPTN